MSNPQVTKRVYTVDKIEKAYELMQLDLGPNAYISEQRKIRQKGILGFLKKRQIEAVAQLDQPELFKQYGTSPVQQRVFPRVNKVNVYDPNGVEPKTSHDLPNNLSPELTQVLKRVMSEKEKQSAKLLNEALSNKAKNEAERNKMMEMNSEVEQESKMNPSSLNSSSSLNLTPQKEAKQEPTSPSNSVEIEKMQHELKEVKETLVQFMNQKQEQSSVAQPTSVNQPVVMNEDAWPEWLEDYQFSSLVLKGLKDYLASKGYTKQRLTRDLLKAFVEQTVNEKITFSEMNDEDTLVLIGPTGAGKTTTLSKIGAKYAFDEDKVVGFVTFDVYRIGAVQQLEIYADILNSSIEVAYTQNQLRERIQDLKTGTRTHKYTKNELEKEIEKIEHEIKDAQLKNKDCSSLQEELRKKTEELRTGKEVCEKCDLVLVDSIGRSYRDEKNVEALKEFVKATGTEQVHLVLNATMNYRELRKIIERYKEMGYSQFIFTKLDEGEYCENILNVCYEYPYPISFVCTGQIVPHDIEKPTAEKLVKYILEGVANE